MVHAVCVILSTWATRVESVSELHTKSGMLLSVGSEGVTNGGMPLDVGVDGAEEDCSEDEDDSEGSGEGCGVYPVCLSTSLLFSSTILPGYR